MIIKRKLYLVVEDEKLYASVYYMKKAGTSVVDSMLKMQKQVNLEQILELYNDQINW